MPVEFVNELPANAKTAAGGNGARAARMTNEAELLKTRPHAWGIIGTRKSKETASALASNIRRGKNASFKDGKYETATHEVEDGTVQVLARYIGPAETPSSF